MRAIIKNCLPLMVFGLLSLFINGCNLPDGKCPDGKNNQDCDTPAPTPSAGNQNLIQLGVSGQYTSGQAVSVDGSGDIFVAGYTSGNLASCQGRSKNCSGNSTGVWDYFVSKYNSSQVWQWTQQLGQASTHSRAYGVATDKEGNVYVTGWTTGNLGSCGGVSSNCSGVSTGMMDYFVSKYSSSGVWKWTRQLGEKGPLNNVNEYLGYGEAVSIAVDSSDNLYVAGWTTGNLVSCNGVSANCTGVSAGSTDYFISKYSSSGDWQWTQQLGQSERSTGALSITLDSQGNVLVAGNTQGNLPSCGGISANCSGLPSDDYFISKYSTSGVWQWTQQLGAFKYGSMTYGTGVATDSYGNVYVTGYTNGDLTTCGGGISANCIIPSNVESYGYYISKYDPYGSWQWTRELRDFLGTTQTNGLVIDTSGYIYVTGQTQGNLTSCDGTSASCSGLSQGIHDFFVSKYNSSGTWQWTQQIGEVSADTVAFGIAASSLGNIYVTGYTTGNLAGCTTETCNVFSQGLSDFFLTQVNH